MSVPQPRSQSIIPSSRSRASSASSAIYDRSETDDEMQDLIARSLTTEAIVAAMPQHIPTVLPTEPVEAGKGGEGGDFQITNAEFIAAVFPHLPEGAFAAVCSKSGDPSLGGWSASRADQVAEHSFG